MTKWLFLLLAVFSTLTRATRIHDEGMIRTLQAEESVSRSFRVMMSPFHLVLAKTPEQLSDVEMDDLFGVLSSVIETYIRSQLEQTEASLQYMFLRDMEDQYYQNNQTTLSFPLGGIAQFSGSDRISSQTLDEWTQYALEFILPGVLQSGGAGSAPLSQVEFSVYLTDRPTDESIQNNTPPSTKQPSKNDIIIIVISVAATLVVVAVVAWLVSRYYGPRRHDHTKDSSTSIQTAEARSPSSERPSPAQRSSADDRSEDSFTVQTEAGDSTAMKSIHPHLLLRSEGPTTMEPFQPVVSVRKDMLASSSWVEDVPNVATPPQVESVLAPSHFAASNEEHARRMRMHQQIQAEAWDDGGEAEEIRFESAHEEEEGKHAVLESVSSF